MNNLVLKLGTYLFTQ